MIDGNKARSHVPVMAQEVIECLLTKQDGRYIDCTFGRGGHSNLILQALGGEAKLLAIDRDWDAINSNEANRLRSLDKRFEIVKSRFSRLREIAEERGWMGSVSGILMDLGVSSPQLEDSGRGFSFLSDGPLDMRMDVDDVVSAAQWLASVPEAELVHVLREYGEERYAKRIAKSIADARLSDDLARTKQLVEIIENAVPSREKNKHPATRTFQAIRIYLNRELEELKHTLSHSIDILAPGGRLVVIAFHSLEDRIVKRFIRDQSRGGGHNWEGRLVENRSQPTFRRIGKARKPSGMEISKNVRARSAVMRVAERLV